jgi:hypothetical protein
VGTDARRRRSDHVSHESQGRRSALRRALQRLDYNAMANLFAEDADWIPISPVEPRKGREAIRQGYLLEFPRFRGHLMAGPFGLAERMSVDAQDPAVHPGVPS